MLMTLHSLEKYVQPVTVIKDLNGGWTAGTLCISNKYAPITTTYCLNNVPLIWSISVQYLGLTITSNLCWTKHCKIISAKAAKCFNYLRYILWSATPTVKSIAYRVLYVLY